MLQNDALGPALRWHIDKTQTTPTPFVLGKPPGGSFKVVGGFVLINNLAAHATHFQVDSTLVDLDFQVIFP